MNQTTKNTHTKDIERLVEQLNDAWLNDQIEDMETLFHKQVVMIEPGIHRKITGREVMINSYREFIDSAEIIDFKIKDTYIDLFETTAVVLYTFRIKYRVETTNYDETGTEILVFNRHNNDWKIVWRHQNPTEVS